MMNCNQSFLPIPAFHQRLPSGRARKASGKWSCDEENYAQELIVAFENGKLQDCEEGVTLRCYLSRKLNCSPMRITKKYAGKHIGKLVYTKHILPRRLLLPAVLELENSCNNSQATNDFATMQNKPPKCYYYSDEENNASAFNAIFKFSLMGANQSGKAIKTIVPSNYYADHDTTDDEGGMQQPTKRMRLAESSMVESLAMTIMSALQSPSEAAKEHTAVSASDSDCDNSVGSFAASISSAVTEYSTTESTLSSDEESDWDEQAMWDELLPLLQEQE